MKSSRSLTEGHRVLISILAAEAVEQFLAEGSDPTGCAQENFCAQCGWELKLERRGTGFLCPRCARKKGGKALA